MNVAWHVDSLGEWLVLMGLVLLILVGILGGIGALALLWQESLKERRQ